jgi:hypothetical protein
MVGGRRRPALVVGLSLVLRGALVFRLWALLVLVCSLLALVALTLVALLRAGLEGLRLLLICSLVALLRAGVEGLRLLICSLLALVALLRAGLEGLRRAALVLRLMLRRACLVALVSLSRLALVALVLIARARPVWSHTMVLFALQTGSQLLVTLDLRLFIAARVMVVRHDYFDDG